MDIQKSLTNLQNECNLLYEAYGATEEIMQLQIAVNTLRHKFDIPDETKLTESNKGFVQ